MKAIRTLTSPKSSPRLPPSTTPAARRSFHNTPQEASSSQLSTHQHQHPYHQRPKHDTGKMAYSSSSVSGSGSGQDAARRQGDGIAFDEDVIEELRPIFAERARAGEGRTRREGQLRGMGTGRGAEWVW